MPKVNLNEVTREQFIEALAILVWDIVSDVQGQRGFKGRAKSEDKALTIVCAKAGVTLTEDERGRILG